MNKYRLKVYPKGRGREIYRVIEISGSESLDNLCSAIIETFGLDSEHLYEFCMENRTYDEHNYQSNPEYQGQPSTKVKIDSLKLKESQVFSLHYDFGDDWMFVINVQKIEQSKEEFVPVVIKSKGFISQYSVWDV